MLRDRHDPSSTSDNGLAQLFGSRQQLRQPLLARFGHLALGIRLISPELYDARAARPITQAVEYDPGLVGEPVRATRGVSLPLEQTRILEGSAHLSTRQ